MKPTNSKLGAVCASGKPMDAMLVLPHDLCQSVGDVLARIGDKWSVLVIYMLSRRRMRFSELKRSLGSISQKVLSTTLRGLERDGYVVREVTASNPPRVDYELTELGHDALGPVTTLATWAMSRREDVERARKTYDGRPALSLKTEGDRSGVPG